MRKIIIFSVTLVLLTVTACSNKDVIKHHYVFRGENESWTAVYEEKDTLTFTHKNGVLGCDSKSDGLLTVTYKKDISDLGPVKKTEISYYNSSGLGGATTSEADTPSLLTERTFTEKSSNSIIANNDEVIKVTITIDGNAQSFELKSKK